MLIAKEDSDEKSLTTACPPRNATSLRVDGDQAPRTGVTSAVGSASNLYPTPSNTDVVSMLLRVSVNCRRSSISQLRTICQRADAEYRTPQPWLSVSASFADLRVVSK